jgi:hypothetical protein
MPGGGEAVLTGSRRRERPRVAVCQGSTSGDRPADHLPERTVHGAPHDQLGRGEPRRIRSVTRPAAAIPKAAMTVPAAASASEDVRRSGPVGRAPVEALTVTA